MCVCVRVDMFLLAIDAPSLSLSLSPSLSLSLSLSYEQLLHSKIETSMDTHATNFQHAGSLGEESNQPMMTHEGLPFHASSLGEESIQQLYFQPMSLPVVGCLQEDNMQQPNVQEQVTGCLRHHISQPINIHHAFYPEVISTNFLDDFQQPSFQQQVSQDFTFLEPCNHMAFQPSNQYLVESTAIRHETTRRIREYWALKKRESRRRKRERDASYSSEYMTMVCKKVVKCWQVETQGMDLDARKNTFQQLLQQSTFRMLQPSSPNIEKSILCNIQHTLNQVKVSQSTEELKLKRAACMMMLNNEGDTSRYISNSQMAKLTGLHRQNFAAANARLKQGEDGEFPLQLCQRPRPQSNIITIAIKELVFGFWQTETRVSPNKKDVCRKRLGRKSYTKHPVHLLDESQVLPKLP